MKLREITRDLRRSLDCRLLAKEMGLTLDPWQDRYLASTTTPRNNSTRG